MQREDFYQYALIGAGVIVTAFIGAFFYRELFPEYKIYQNDYVALETFRSSYTHEPPPDFKVGIKQIVLEREDKGPAVIDRCTSCHVALQIPYFSPTKAIKNSQGEIEQVKNEDYIWDKLDQEIAKLRATNDPAAEKLEKLKIAEIGEHTYNVKKVLAMHPLIGKETRPFEFHPLEEYGCTSCHSGNGRALTTDKAHGPVFDEFYEHEFMGPKPEFLEQDSKNDPVFSKVFNHKPGDSLLFQTEPIFVGALIQAKCVQCHNPSEPSSSSDIHRMTENYQRGEELFVSQACYACHRIAAFSRGGVGPELTKEGTAYPWFIKESIVWPQADVKDSGMPNMRLDHTEIEDLMTFLLAQKGPSKAIAPIEYQIQVQQWEAGKKKEWEKPATSAQIYDLEYSKTVFATEGCAACHRLEGFASDIGFKLEKDSTHSEKIESEREWFKSLFPQIVSGGAYNGMPPGSELAATIEKYAKEIDERIVDDVRKDSLLEKLEKVHPGLLESYYSNFNFAARSKEDSEWKTRVHKVLMTYIQVYGLGRMIGPLLNWSGVYRSDEWLMEHFRSPALHIPRSIMPVMPFDDTKFYALTHLLDKLGIRNREAVRKIWETQGFNPAKAYEIHCAQCHGVGMIGNGPVSEWIYPIPKNLQSSAFLRQLTKEQAIHSITHGVKGTPMAPWGELGEGKPEEIKKESGGKAVLSKAEIELLVDWIFSGLSGEETLKEPKDILKWQYTPEDILKELKDEGSDLKALPPKLKLGFIHGKEIMLFGAFSPFIVKMPSNETVEDLFDIKPSPFADKEGPLYYIKEKFYTPYNIEEGKKLFVLNCSVCHGTEAEGSGVRAQAMREAKPRMLTNLDWINSHDDLRLLRSIKYGVPGTSMTPWGDFTSALQRLQIVIFIRSLSDEKEKKEKLDKAIYKSFDESIFVVDKAGVSLQLKLDEHEQQLKEIESNLDKLEKSGQVAEAVKAFQDKLELEKTYKQELSEKEQLDQVKAELKQERERYFNLGINLTMKTSNPDILTQYVELIHQLENRIVIENGKLVWKEETGKKEMIRELKSSIVKKMEEELNLLKEQLKAIEGRVSSAEQKQEAAAIEAEIKAYETVIGKVETDILTQRTETQKKKKEQDMQDSQDEE